MIYLAPFLALLAAVIYLTLFVWTLRSRVNAIIRVNLSLYFFILLVWQVAGVGIILAERIEAARIFYGVFIPSSIGFLYMFLPISVAFFNPKRARIVTIITLGFYAANIAAGLFLKFNENLYVGNGGFYVPSINNLVVLTNIPSLLFYILGILYILIQRKRETSLLRRNRISYLLSASIIIFIGLFANITPLKEYPVDVICTLVSGGLLAYGILRHRILNIKKSLQRVALFLLGLIAMIGLLLVFSQIFSRLTNLTLPFVFNIPAITSFAVLFLLVLVLTKKDRLSPLLSRFMPDQARYNELLADFTDRLKNVFDLPTISNHFYDSISAAFPVKWVTLHLVDHSQTSLALALNRGEEVQTEAPQNLQKEDSLVLFLKKEGLVVMEELLDSDEGRLQAEAVSHLFKGSTPEILVPLTLRNETLGLACITLDTAETDAPDAQDIAHIASIAEHTTNAIARSLAYEHLRQDVIHKENLLKEVHHRVKNNLQIISSLFSLQRSSAKDSKVESIFRTAQKRIQAVSKIHEMLYKGNSFSLINVHDYLSSLIEVFHETASEKRKISFTLEVSDIEIDIETALPFCLAVNELVSNAVKHAFEESGGTITVRIEKADGPSLVCSIKDDGKGMEEQEIDTGIGHNIVDIFIRYQLGGTWEILHKDGTEHRITIPLG